MCPSILAEREGSRSSPLNSPSRPGSSIPGTAYLPITDHRLPGLRTQGLGRGVGRPLGDGAVLGVGVGRGVVVGVAVAVAVGVAVGVGVTVGVAVGMGVLVGVGVADGDAVGVGVGGWPPGNTRTE